MPVRRPRRPAAVSAADAAGAGPELGCAGQLEQAAEAPIDEASSLCVGLSVDRSVDRSGLVSGRDLYLVYPGLVAFAGVRSPRRVLSNHGDRTFLASRLCFASLGRSAAVLVRRIYPGLVAFAGVRPPRRVSWNRRCWVWLGGVVVESAGACLFSRARAGEPPPFAVRCVFFSVDRGVGRFSSRNWNCRSFCGASPATPASDARQHTPGSRKFCLTSGGSNFAKKQT